MPRPFLVEAVSRADYVFAEVCLRFDSFCHFPQYGRVGYNYVHTTISDFQYVINIIIEKYYTYIYAFWGKNDYKSSSSLTLFIVHCVPYLDIIMR